MEYNYGTIIAFAMYAFIVGRGYIAKRKAATDKDTHDLKMLIINNTIREQGIEIKSIQDTLNQMPFISFAKAKNNGTT